MKNKGKWYQKMCPKCISLIMVQEPREINFCEKCGTKLESHHNEDEKRTQIQLSR